MPSSVLLLIKKSKMEWDDFVYATLLVICVPFGVLIKQTVGYRQKQVLCSAAGVFLVAVVCGRDGLHSLLTALVNACIVSYISPRKCHLVSFAWCFGYIAFFRTTHYFGLPKVVPHANAVQLLLTLKLVGLAYEVHDDFMNKEAAKKDEGNEDLKLKCKYQEVKPSFKDMMHYSYCYIGLLTGPYYKYRTYHDMLTSRGSEHISVLKSLGAHIYYIPAVALAFLVFSNFFYIEYVRSDEFYENPFWYRLWFMVPMFFVFRMRMYFAWLMSEVVCITANLGSYPVSSRPRCGAGPMDFRALKESKDQEHNYETIHNIDMYGCEWSPSVKLAMKHWNMSVQYWLAHHVYKRVTSKQWRTTVTMVVSAFWHGIHGGYYLSFLTIPPTMMAESLMQETFCDGRPESWQSVYFYWSRFITMRFLDYMCMGFLILGGWQTLRYWASIYFFYHLVILLFFILGTVFKPKKSKSGTSAVNDVKTSDLKAK